MGRGQLIKFVALLSCSLYFGAYFLDISLLLRCLSAFIVSSLRCFLLVIAALHLYRPAKRNPNLVPYFSADLYFYWDIHEVLRQKDTTRTGPRGAAPWRMNDESIIYNWIIVFLVFLNNDKIWQVLLLCCLWQNWRKNTFLAAAIGEQLEKIEENCWNDAKHMQNNCITRAVSGSTWISIAIVVIPYVIVHPKRKGGQQRGYNI